MVMSEFSRGLYDATVADPGGLTEPPFGSLISMKNTDLNVYFCSKVPFRESMNPHSNPPSQNPGSAPVQYKHHFTLNLNYL